MALLQSMEKQGNFLFKYRGVESLAKYISSNLFAIPIKTIFFSNFNTHLDILLNNYTI